MSDQETVKLHQPVAQNSRMLGPPDHADTTAIVVQKGHKYWNEVVVVGFGKQKEVAGVISKSEAETKTPNSAPPDWQLNRFKENIYKTLKVNPQKKPLAIAKSSSILKNATPVNRSVLQSPIQMVPVRLSGLSNRDLAGKLSGGALARSEVIWK